MSLGEKTRAELSRHRDRGREFTAAGVQSFVLDHGQGEPVVLMHGVPASSYLYRKVADELATRDLRAIAFDLPGLGFAGRPEEFDYSWSGLGRFARAAVDALGLERFHLVVHDIGGPVGFELAAHDPDRVMSLTILNTLIDVDGFVKPWVMRPFEMRGLGEIWLATLNPYSMNPLMRLIGVKDRSAIAAAEIGVYATQLKAGDGGRAFLKIMRGFEPTAEKAAVYKAVLRDAQFPIEIVWGEYDTALSLKKFGAEAQRLAPQAKLTAVRGRHFLQEEQPARIAERIAAAARTARG